MHCHLKCLPYLETQHPHVMRYVQAVVMEDHGKLRDTLQLVLPLHGNDGPVQLEDVPSGAVQLPRSPFTGLGRLLEGLVGQLDELLDCCRDLRAYGEI